MLSVKYLSSETGKELPIRTEIVENAGVFEWLFENLKTGEICIKTGYKTRGGAFKGLEAHVRLEQRLGSFDEAC